jgi:hypothetical protein
MKILPWILMAAAIAGAVFFFTNSQKLETEVRQLRVEFNGLAKLRTENAELKKSSVSPEEVERLQKETAEVHKLRNEVRQLRDEKEKLTARIQQEQVDINTAARPVVARGEITLEQLQRENEQLRNENEQFHRVRIRSEMNACINNLRQLDGAKEQWALENRKAIGDLPTWEELIGPTGYIRKMPACPQGGQYTLNGVGQEPTCTLPGHQLPQ